MSSPQQQHGLRRPTRGLALPTVLLLITAVALLAGLTQGVLLLDLRTAAHQVRTLQAQHAAQAGVAWSVALLNTHRYMDAHCQPAPASSSSPAAGPAAPGSLRERWWPGSVAPVAGPGAHASHAAPGSAAAAAIPALLPHVGCIHHGDAWHCHCGAPPAGVNPSAPAQRFIAELSSPEHPAAQNSATARSLTVTACTGPGLPCNPQATAPAGAVHRLRVTLGPAAAFARQPHAALTATGHIHGTGRLLFDTTGVAAGLLAHAGGDITETLLTSAAAGHLPDAATVPNDPQLATLAGDALEQAFLGWHQDALQALPNLDVLPCSAGCVPALTQALSAGARAIVLQPQDEAPVRIPTHPALSQPHRPVLLLVQGPAVLDAALDLHGLLFARGLHVPDHAQPPAVRGAVVVAGDARIDGPVRLQHDPTLLHALRDGVGPMAILPGSWRTP